MSNPLRLGIIGTSWWMDMSHLPMFKADTRVEMVAICGRNRDRAQEMASKYGIANVYTDYRALIAKGQLDAIVIGAPDDEHYAMTMAALEAGLHVLCEKPLALNARHAKAMLDHAEAKGVRHMTVFINRWLPHYQTMRQLIAAGTIGRIYHCHFKYFFGAWRNTQYAWRMDRTRANGALGDIGAHMFDLARFLVGDIARVNAQLSTNIARLGIDGQPLLPANDAATILFEFTHGGKGTVEVSGVARIADPFLEHQVEIHGELGSLVAETKMGSSPLSLRLALGNDPFQPVSIPAEFCVGFDLAQPPIAQMQTLFTQQPVAGRLFVDGILENRPVEPNFYDGWKAQQVIDATLVSHETGQWVTIQ